MRGEQLSNITSNLLGSDVNISYKPATDKFKNAILFLTKGVIQVSEPLDLENLKAQRNRLIFDPVDAHLSAVKAQYADVIVAASRTAFEDYTSSFSDKRIILVDHHIDPRLKNLGWHKSPSHFRAGYFGELINTFSTPKIEKLVDFVQVDTFRQTDSWLKKLPNYNLHYAIRQIRQRDYHKPFLKGFTAAHCSSNILIQDSQKEAVLWLGKDYPYLLKGEVTERKVLEQLNYIKESYGSAEWKRGLDIMMDIKEKTSEEAIGRQLQELFRETSQI